MDERDTELAAALAAVDAFLRAEADERAASEATAPHDRAAWREAARLAACGVAAPRGSRACWSVVERWRRGAGGLYGVIGL